MNLESNALEPEFAALDEVLASGLEAMGQQSNAAMRQKLLAYIALLKHWARAYNLTAIVEPREMVARHLLDSLSLLPWITGRRIVDSGTGAGLPGVPLAIALPERHFTLIDGNGKKVRFLRQVRRTLGLDNVEPVQARLEALPDMPVPDQITARALAPLSRLVEWHRDWLDQGAELLAMKSREIENELSDLPAVYNVQLNELELPGEPVRRCLAIVTKKVTQA